MQANFTPAESVFDRWRNQDGAAVQANFVTAKSMFDSWRDDLKAGKAPILYPIGTGELSRIEIGPGLINLFGGGPGTGKTAFVMQAVVDALRATPTLRALICNVEMEPSVLLDRQLARLSGVDLSLIRKRQLMDEHADRIDHGMDTLADLSDRLCFLEPPFNLDNVAAAADAFGAGLIMLDYIQRIPPPGKHSDKRGSMDACMNSLRQFASNGVAVVVVSAVGRTKDDRGRSSYAAGGLNLASFRESSELEYGADSAYILAPDGLDGDAVTLRHLKDRYGETRDINLTFDRKHMCFTVSESIEKPQAGPDKGKKQAGIPGLWNRTPAMPPESDGAA